MIVYETRSAKTDAAQPMC